MADDQHARVVAFFDQRAAELRDLALTASHHLAGGCTADPPCPGSDVLHQIVRMSRMRLHALLALAVAELARLGYGETADPAAEAALMMTTVRTAAQLRADIDAAGGEPDDDGELPPRSGARARALAKLAREYPDRFRELHEAEIEASGGESRRMARARNVPRVDRIRALAAQKLTDREIGDVLDMKPTAVAHLRRSNGIPPGLGRTGRPSGWPGRRGAS